MKYIYILTLLLLTPLWLFAQNDVITFNTANTTGGNIEACEGIVLAHGFSFTATAGKSMTFSINREVCSPRQETISGHSSKNYIATVTPLDESTKVQITNGIVSVDRDSRALINIQYVDGLGRPIQTVQKGAGPQNQDLVTALEYDDFGREWKSYLPTPVAGNNGALVSDILTKAKTAYSNDQKPFSEMVYEPSPLNRVERQYGPGQAWNPNSNGTGGYSVKTEYLTNNATYPCRNYTVSGDNLVKNATDYAAGNLYVVKTTDEDNKVSYEFKDISGKVLLHRQMDVNTSHDTYYVYDDLKNLRFVLSPMASDALKPTTTTTYNPASNVTLKDYAYIYKYDNRNRCIEKKLPGVDPVYMVYDKADRVIFSKDGEQSDKNKWTFSIPDDFGRIVLTGICNNTFGSYTIGNIAFESKIVKAVYNGDAKYNPYYGYKITVDDVEVLPTAVQVLNVNYYDNYEFKFMSDPNYTYTTPSGFDNKRYGTNSDKVKSKGLLTGTITTILDAGISIGTIFYYDDKGRMIQSIAANHLGGYEKEYINYSFTGKPVWKQSIHSAPGKSNITEIYKFAYDHADRPTVTKYQLNNEPEFALSALAYDDKGRLASKIQNGNAMTTTYEYNIRNWLKSINSMAFTENIYYNESYAGNVPQYNGNISAVSWKHLISSSTKGYLYTYDGLNRLKKGQFLSGTTPNDAFTEEITQYDKNGNIIEMKRYARISANGNIGMVDWLGFSRKGNQIINMEDTAPFAGSGGLILPNANSNIKYNNNGAMTQNCYNGIATITYNVLNLPEKIQFVYGHNTRYSYDAAGVKRQVVHQSVKSNMNIQLGNTTYTPNPNDILNTLTTDYCAGGHIVYENGQLKMILNPEGYVTKLSNGMSSYNCYAKDHLGNNRAVFGTTPPYFGGPQQEISYYPFGMPHNPVQQPGDGVSPEYQPYKFGGKELDNMHGLNLYDNILRNYDPAICRFL
ncbi:MAG: DUF6443 domain-containing protein, partial [Dysgonamonadaceae bacterium]|nr:DUF6443 domain-containing protein [Dysgonamonadaceae bacterium]